MPRRCWTCGEPGANVAAFCGRCGALSSGRRPAGTTRPRRRARRTPRSPVGLRPLDVLAGGLAIVVIGVFAAGLELDRAAGEVSIPATVSTDTGTAEGTPSPGPPPGEPAAHVLASCDDPIVYGEVLCVRWQRPRTADQLVVADGSTVYLAQADGELEALERTTGDLRWNAAVGIGVLHNATTGPAGLVVTGAGGPGPEEAVARLDPRDGTVTWTTVAGADVEVVDGGESGLLLFEPRGLRRLDPATGAERWRWATSDPAGVALVAGTDDAPVVSTARTLSATDVATGEARWQVSLPQLRGAAAGSDGRLVAIGGGGALVGVDVRSGAIAWESRLEFDDSSAVRITGTDGLVIVEIAMPQDTDGTRMLRLVGVDPGTGAVRWIHRARSSLDRRHMVLTPTAAVLVGTATAGTIASLDLATGSLGWQRVLGSEPAHVRVLGDQLLAASGRDLLLLAAGDGSVIATARMSSPVIGVVSAGDGAAVLKTTTEILAVAVPGGT